MKNKLLLNLLIIAFISISVISCRTTKDTGIVIGTVETTVATPQINSDYAWRYGVITAIQFTNKIGKGRPEYDEYFFLCAEGEFFIKLMECKNLSSLPMDYENYYIKMHALIKDGLLDTDDPNMQSRVGAYIIFDSISPIDLPTKIIYSDGSGNSYKIEPNSIIYTPVKPAESSSGTYSGGNAINIDIDIAQFNEIFIRSEKLMTNKDIQSKNREMGTGSMKVTFSNSEMKAIIKKGKKLQSFQAYLDSIIIKIN